MSKEQEKESKYQIIKMELIVSIMMRYNQNSIHLKKGLLYKLNWKTVQIKQAIDHSVAEEKMETTSKILAQIVPCPLVLKMRRLLETP